MPFNTGDRVVYLGGGGQHLNQTPGFLNSWVPGMDSLRAGTVLTVLRQSEFGIMFERGEFGHITGGFQWPQQVFRLEGEPEPAAERYLIFNSATNRIYAVQEGGMDSVTYDEGVRVMRQALNINSARVLHLIPLRSVTKVDILGTEDYRV